MTSVTELTKKHAAVEESKKQWVHNGHVLNGHPLNPNTVFPDLPKIELFDNGPIHIRHGSPEGEDTYLDWSEPSTNLLAETRNLHEALLHRNPNSVKAALAAVESNLQALKTYLQARGVVVVAEEG